LIFSLVLKEIIQEGKEEEEVKILDTKIVWIQWSWDGDIFRGKTYVN